MAPPTDMSSKGSDDPFGGVLGQGPGGDSVGNQGANSPRNQGENSLGNLGANSLGNLGTDPVGDLGGSSIGKHGRKSGGSLNPATSSKGEDPLSQALLPGRTLSQPFPGTTGSPVTSSDTTRSASQSAQPAYHTKAPSPSDLSDDKLHSQGSTKTQTQSTIRPSSTPYASASPSPSANPSGEASHLVGPIMGVIFVLGVMSLAGMLFLQYHRRRREAARKQKEDENAITFINQLSQYDKPTFGEKI